MPSGSYDPEAHRAGLGEHLSELRRRIVVVAAVFVPVTLIGLTWSKQVMAILLRNSPPTFFFAPAEAFGSHLRVAMLLGVAATWPVILLQGYLFAVPGLYPAEKKALLWIIPSGVILFVAGAAFAYFVIVPFFGRWLESWAREGVTPSLSLKLYIGFVTRMILVASLTFQLPLTAVILSSLELVSSSTLTRQRRWVIIIIFVLSAIITPPDPVSQMLVAGPMWALFEISVQLSRLVEYGAEKRRRRSRR